MDFEVKPRKKKKRTRRPPTSEEEEEEVVSPLKKRSMPSKKQVKFEGDQSSPKSFSPKLNFA